NPAHISQHPIVRSRPPLPAQSLAAPGRVKSFAVYPTRQPLRVAEAGLLQLGRLLGGCYQGRAGAVMKPAQVTPGQTGEETEPVVGKILVKIGMKTTDNRQLATSCCLQRC